MCRTQTLLLLSFVVAGCGESPPGGDDTVDPTDDARLVIAVGTPQLHWTDGVPETSTLVVMRVAADGTETDVTAESTFSISPVEIANTDNATLTPTGQAAGLGQVYASAAGLIASSEFTVHVSDRVPGTGDAQASLFENATLDPASALTIAYPPARAMIPPNIGEMDVHWRDTASKDVYEVQLSGGFVTLRTYVARLGTASWTTLDGARWEQLSSGSRGVDLALRVRGIATASPATFVESTETLRIAAEAVKGGVYYWNTSKAAIMRFDMSKPTVAPEQFYPQVGQTGCVGCHAVSRDGKIVAYRQEGDNMNYGNGLDVATQQRLLTANTQRWNFAAVHPNNSDLFTTEETGIYRTDLATGQRTPLYTASRISHPDVAATGDAIVATQVLAGNEVWTSSGQIVVFDYDQTAKTVGAPRPLVQPSGGAFAFYPSFSPDNTWVLYNQASGGSSYDNRNAELWVTKADGSLAAPIRLGEAEVAGTYNSWPKWTPFVTREPTATGDEPVIWFTLASRRPFGVRSSGTQKPQLWLASFYPERALAGMPATGPAIRLPFQLLNEGNHIAQWTQQIVTLE